MSFSEVTISFGLNNCQAFSNARWPPIPRLLASRYTRGDKDEDVNFTVDVLVLLTRISVR